MDRGVGLGWIPNRFFRADFSTFWVGTNPNAALLGNDQARVGQNMTFQPKLGASYVFCDFKNLQATIFAGNYYEVSRVSGAVSRYHKTAGSELKPWIFTLGAGIDSAPDYKNFIASVNVDVFKVLEQLSLIPAKAVTHDGFFPNPFFMSDAGLARPLVNGWAEDPEGIDPLKVGLEMPSKVIHGVSKIPENGSQIFQSIPSKLSDEFNEMKKAQGNSSESMERKNQQRKAINGPLRKGGVPTVEPSAKLKKRRRPRRGSLDR